MLLLLFFYRVYQTFTRSIFEGASNLAVFGGDAIDIVGKYFPENIITHIFINYPEPPQQVGGNETQSKHLLSEVDYYIIFIVFLNL